jgi:hypothetical protein
MQKLRIRSKWEGPGGLGMVCVDEGKAFNRGGRKEKPRRTQGRVCFYLVNALVFLCVLCGLSLRSQRLKAFLP